MIASFLSSFIIAFSLLLCVLHIGWILGAYAQRQRDDRRHLTEKADLYEHWLKEGFRQHRRKVIERTIDAQKQSEKN